MIQNLTQEKTSIIFNLLTLAYKKIIIMLISYQFDLISIIILTHWDKLKYWINLFQRRNREYHIRKELGNTEIIYSKKI